MPVSFSRNDKKVFAQFTNDENLLQSKDLAGLGTDISAVPDDEKLLLLKCYVRILQMQNPSVVVYMELGKRFMIIYTQAQHRQLLSALLKTLSYRDLTFTWKALIEPRPMPLDTRWLFMSL